MDEREAYLLIASGQQGVGKSYRTLMELREYTKSNGNRKGRPVIIFDTNNEYKEFKTIDFDITLTEPIKGSKKTQPRENAIVRHVVEFCRKCSNGELTPDIRRIVPFKKNREQMDVPEKVLTAKLLLRNCRNCCLLLEDINTYMIGAKGTAVIGTLTNKRHRNQDIIIHVQSISKIDPTMFENVNVIRMHHQPSPITRLAYKAGNMELLEIAKTIVDNEYHLKGNQRYFIYVLPQIGKIQGCTEEQFREGCKIYAEKNYSKTIKPLLNRRDLSKNGNSTKLNDQTALNQFIQERMHYLN